MKNAIYAVYKGDVMLVIGTADECAEKLNVTAKSIYRLATDAYKRQMKKQSISPENARVAEVIDWEEVN